MVRLMHTVAIAGLLLIAVGVASCGGGGSTKTGQKTFEATIRSFKGGTANANVMVGTDSIAYTGGTCEKGAGDKYLALNIGDVNGSGDYFGLLAGQHPAAAPAARSTSGGGEFAGQDQALVTFRHGGRSYLLRFTETKITLAPDISSGSVSGELTSSDAATTPAAVSGTFTC